MKIRVKDIRNTEISDNPFDKKRYGNVQVLDIKDGYVQYTFIGDKTTIQPTPEDDFKFSTSIKFFEIVYTDIIKRG